jgi:hypothetical protein
METPMHRLLASAALATTVLALGCTADTATAPEAVTLSSQLSRHAADVPIRGRCETVTQVIGMQFGPTGPTQLTLWITGTCQLSHLGRSTTSAVQVVDLATGTFTAENTVYVAANGDVLQATHTGTITSMGADDSVTFTGTQTFGGGTGRFASAAGSADFMGGASGPDVQGRGAGFLELDGRIAYRAAERGK